MESKLQVAFWIASIILANSVRDSLKPKIERKELSQPMKKPILYSLLMPIFFIPLFAIFLYYYNGEFFGADDSFKNFKNSIKNGSILSLFYILPSVLIFNIKLYFGIKSVKKSSSNFL